MTEPHTDEALNKWVLRKLKHLALFYLGLLVLFLGILSLERIWAFFMAYPAEVMLGVATLMFGVAFTFVLLDVRDSS